MDNLTADTLREIKSRINILEEHLVFGKPLPFPYAKPEYIFRELEGIISTFKTLSKEPNIGEDYYLRTIKEGKAYLINLGKHCDIESAKNSFKFKESGHFGEIYSKTEMLEKILGDAINWMPDGYVQVNEIKKEYYQL
jgi:hypothetical protein